MSILIHKEAELVADAYNRTHKITCLNWSANEKVWELWHQGNKSNQSYSDSELVDVGTRLGWGGE